MIDLHYCATPNGQKIAILLEEAELPYRVIPYDIFDGDQLTAEFGRINPNHKLPAIVDHAPAWGGGPVTVFESGAILQYLGRKTGQFYPADERGRVAVDEWLFWQMGGFGPMLGQTHHFRLYAPEKVPYAIDRYTNETNRLYGVLNKRLEGRDYICGDYSIADMACIGWARGWEKQGQDLKQFPNVARWLETMLARPAVQRGIKVGEELRNPAGISTPEEKAILFGQKAR